MSALGSYLQIEDTVLGLQVAGKSDVFQAIGRHMERVHCLPADRVVAALLRRESTGSTAVGRGVAIPHARLRDLDGIRALYLRLSPAVSFDTPDGRAVTDVLVLMVPDPAVQLHLDILAHAVALFGDDGFRAALHQCTEPRQAKALFDRWPAQPLPSPRAVPRAACGMTCATAGVARRE